MYFQKLSISTQYLLSKRPRDRLPLCRLISIIMFLTIAMLLTSGCELVIRAAALPFEAASKALNKSDVEAAEKKRIQERNERLHMHGLTTNPHKHVNSGEGEHSFKYSCLAKDENNKMKAYPSNIDCGTVHMHGPDKAPHRHNTADKKHGIGFECLWDVTRLYTSDIFCSDHNHSHVHWNSALINEHNQASAHKHLHEHTGKHEHKFMCHKRYKVGGPSNIECKPHNHSHLHGPDTESHIHFHTHEGEHDHASEEKVKDYCRSHSLPFYSPSNIDCKGVHTHSHLHKTGTAPHTHAHKFEGDHKHENRCKYEGRIYPSIGVCPK